MTCLVIETNCTSYWFRLIALKGWIHFPRFILTLHCLFKRKWKSLAVDAFKTKPSLLLFNFRTEKAGETITGRRKNPKRTQIVMIIWSSWYFHTLKCYLILNKEFNGISYKCKSHGWHEYSDEISDGLLLSVGFFDRLFVCKALQPFLFSRLPQKCLKNYEVSYWGVFIDTLWY